MNPVRLAVVSSGLSVPSSTRLLADRLAEAAGRRLAQAGRGVEVETVELRELAVDIAGNLVTGFPAPTLRRAVEAVTRADALIAVTPVFSASYSGLFKSFFDVLDRDALVGKPVLAAATGGTARHSLALEYALRPLFAHLRAAVTPTAVFAAPEDWGSAGDSRTAALAGRIGRAAAELAALAAAPRPEPAADEEVVPFDRQLEALRTGPR
ncbi:FMN reductase [Streptomyces cirratus]|uniref:FMN reductase n=1 Tax=Streptomyces cirratus TaxID=68187 RepID=A0ABQ3EZT5_9ACTN|nr:CE1759 family FMN reductase [Streptomyces cirratus]GHB59318.1 FMN reductase [Streptomyces cirratus]